MENPERLINYISESYHINNTDELDIDRNRLCDPLQNTESRKNTFCLCGCLIFILLSVEIGAIFRTFCAQTFFGESLFFIL